MKPKPIIKFKGYVETKIVEKSNTCQGREIAVPSGYHEEYRIDDTRTGLKDKKLVMDHYVQPDSLTTNRHQTSGNDDQVVRAYSSNFISQLQSHSEVTQGINRE